MNKKPNIASIPRTREEVEMIAQEIRDYLIRLCADYDNGNIEYILEVMFSFSIIGNQHKHQKNRTFFRYLHTNMTYNREEAIVIHRGLLKALQIF